MPRSPLDSRDKFARWLVAATQRWLIGVAGLIVVQTLFASQVTAQYLATELRTLSRSGGQAGSEFELTVTSGDQIDQVDQMFFSHSGIVAQLQTRDPLPLTDQAIADHGHFTVKVSDKVPAGRYDVRVAGRHGVSNPRAFLISPLTNLAPAAVSHDPVEPTALPTQTLLHASATEATVDAYAIDLDHPQRLQIEILAQRLDSRMIGHLKLYDADGKLLHSRRGADAVDPVLITDPLPAGRYHLLVHDFVYRGGVEYFYQVVAQDVASAVQWHSAEPDVPGELPVVWSLPAISVDPVVDLLAVPREAISPQSIEVPHRGTWWFAPRHEVCVFQFDAVAGDPLIIELISQRLGEPTDARLQLQRMQPDSTGEPTWVDVLQADDSQAIGDKVLSLAATDPSVVWTVPVTGTYRLTVRDLDVGESLSARQAFQLRIDRPQPAVDLVAYRTHPHSDPKQVRPHGSKIFQGGSELIRVFVVRRDGWQGAIEISVPDLPHGLSCEPATIAANQDQVQLVLTASSQAAAGIHTLSIVGRAVASPTSSVALPATLSLAAGGGRDFLQLRRTADLMVAISDQDVAPLTIQLGPDPIHTVAAGQSVSLAVTLTRRAGGQQACVLRPRDLPPGVSAAEVTLDGKTSQGTVQLQVSANTAPGTYSLWMQAETKIKLKPNPQLLVQAEQYRSHLQKLHDDPAQKANLASIQSAIVEADKRVEAAKIAAKEQELTVFVPTNHTAIRVVQP